MKFRDNTWDKAIWNCCNEHNEYGAGRFFECDTVLDVGAHIGGFCHKAHQNGAGRVLGFEAWKDNYDLAQENLKSLPGVNVRNVAVWRSDVPDDSVQYFTPCTEQVNTGGGGLFTKGFGLTVDGMGGVSTKTVSLDSILRSEQAVRFVKFDCEGAEFPILYTSTLLHHIDEMAGEFHEMPGVTFNVNGIDKPACMLTLRDHLELKGFCVFINPHTANESDGTVLGHFYARRIRTINTQSLVTKADQVSSR